MLFEELLLPAESHLNIRQIESAEGVITIFLCSTKKSGFCPDCGTESGRVHSEYQRSPKDLPCMGQTVRLRTRVRRFFCANRSCKRMTFAEQFPYLLVRKAQRTQRLIIQHEEIAFELGGEAGRRLAGKLGMAISGDTLIRAIRKSPEQEANTPRVLGIDDWAKCKSQEYGTILVDLEAHQPVDIIDSRTVEAVAAWLKAHPGIEIVSRDRGREYIKGVSEGAPDADQIADRWHLLSNLREAMVTLLEKKPIALKAAAQTTTPKDVPSVIQGISVESEVLSSIIIESQDTIRSIEATTMTVEPILTKVQQAKIAGDVRRQARFDQVKALYATTHSVRTVADALKMSRRTVTRYITSEICPQYPEGRIRSSQLTPYLKRLQERWQGGCTNASQLWREIQKEGFKGSRGLVARWAAEERARLPVEIRFCRQQSAIFQTKACLIPPVIPWSAKRASWLIVKKPPDLDDEEKEALNRMAQSDPQVALGVDLAQQFMVMVRQREQDKLDDWMETVKNSAIPALLSFANGLRKDFTAVRNALRYSWSNGQTEGQVNRLKFIKRQMYGRAKFDLLRKRVLPRPRRT